MTEAVASRLRVMTFNVRGCYFPDGANAWEHRADLNVATIERAAPDLLGFQETHTGNLKAYNARLPRYWWTAWPEYNNQPPHQWPSIFWDPARLRPRDSGGFWLSETPERFSGSWETDCIRSATWILFECDGGRLLHLNTHLDHISEQARVEGARLIVARLDLLQRETGAAAIVTGDFNAPVGSPAYRVFADAGFTDAYVVAGNDDDPDVAFTYHGWEGAAFRGSDDSPRRIDWVLTRDGERAVLSTVACEILRDATPPVYPSDHYPVVADLEVVPR